MAASVTFEQARRAVLTHMAPHWKPELGSLTTLGKGYQDEHYWRVIAGPREALVQHRDEFHIVDLPAFLVDKENGKVTELPIVTNMDRLDAMRPYGGAS